MTTSYEKYGKKYYELHREKCVERNRVYQAKQKKLWWEFKKTLKCAKCGESHPACIDFHHLDRNDKDKRHVNVLIKNRQYAQAYREVEKCLVVCANCHRKIHWDERHEEISK
jgi:hypothetical protein